MGDLEKVLFCSLFLSVAFAAAQDSATCVPYSEDACRTSAETSGLTFERAGSFKEKGCYAYKDGEYAKKVYYGNDGTKEQMMASPEAPKYRPNGYDCNWCNAAKTCSIANCFNRLVETCAIANCDAADAAKLCPDKCGVSGGCSFDADCPDDQVCGQIQFNGQGLCGSFDYVLGELRKGVPCADQGLTDLDDGPECKSAGPKMQDLVSNSGYGYLGEDSYSPFGCWYHAIINDNSGDTIKEIVNPEIKFYWNNNKNGAACDDDGNFMHTMEKCNSFMQSVCKVFTPAVIEENIEDV